MRDLITTLMAMEMDADNYEERKVARDIIGDYIIDTADTWDCGYETAICKNDGNWVIVEYYADKKEALIGHKKWVEFVKTSPDSVYSVQFGTMEEF